MLNETTAPASKSDPFASIRSLIAIGAVDQARRWLETRLRVIPQGSEAQLAGRLLLSELHAAGGNIQGAIETLEEILAAQPRNREATSRIAELRRAAWKRQAASAAATRDRR